MNKLSILITFIIMNSFQCFSGCISCFSLTRVKITTQSNLEIEGLIPIFSAVYQKLNEDSIGSNSEILKYLQDNQKLFQYTDSLYNIPIIGRSAINEYIKFIHIDSLKSILFLEEFNYRGAGCLTGINLKDAQKLMSVKEADKGYIDTGFCDDLYINTSNQIDSTEFRIFIRYSHIKDERRIPYELTKMNRNGSDFKNIYDLKKIKSIHLIQLNKYRKAVEDLSINGNDTLFSDYINQLYDYHAFKCDVLEKIYENLGDTDYTENYSTYYTNDYWQGQRTFDIDKLAKILSNDNSNGFDKYYALMVYFGSNHKSEWSKLNKLFDSIIDHYGMIVKSNCYDG